MAALGPVLGSIGLGFDVDPAVLKQQGAIFGELGTSFKSAAKELGSALEAAEADWGEEFIGTFNDIYEPVREGMCASMVHLAAQLAEIGGNLRTMGARYECAEDEQTRLMAGQHANLGGGRAWL
ncbi:MULTISPECIES: hypothetical protein [unclassified Streptomyces]|uniref:hypothetical protein n=1 Tax=unclassified Streptomyces TaxID=2593676 RepID=UPI00278BD107|nr:MULTISPECIES: hypothetical protein [unclassified Streptomyces]